MDLTYSGYVPNVLYIEPEKPVRWVINVKQMSGCTDAIMIESLGIEKDLVYGENIIDFTPPSNVEEIKFSCWMKMVWGKFVVTTDKKARASSAIQEIAPPGPACDGSGSCGGSCGGGCGCGGK